MDIKKLTESSDIYQQIFDNSPLAIIILSSKGTVLKVNGRITDWLGYENSEVVGTNVLNMPMLTLKSKTQVVENFTKRMMGREIKPYELEFVSKDKQKSIIGRVRAIPLYDEANKIIGDLILISDVTSLKNSEKLLERRGKILSAVNNVAELLLTGDKLENQMDKVLAELGISTGVSRAYIFQNRTNEQGQFLTTQRYEWVGKGIDPQIDNPGLIDLSWSDSGFERWVKVMESGKEIFGNVDFFPEEEKNILKNQGIVSLLAVPIFQNKKWWGFMGFDECRYERTWTDEEKEALETAANIIGAALENQENLEVVKENEQRFRDFAYSLADWLWETDKDNRYTYASGQVEDVLGYKPEELIGKTPLELMDREEAKRVSDYFSEISSKKSPITDLENWNIRKDGGKVCLLTNGIPVLNEQGVLVGYRGVDKDITKEKDAQRVLEERNAELEKMNELMVGRELKMVELKKQLR